MIDVDIEEELVEIRIDLLHQMNEWCLERLNEREMVDRWGTIRGISDDLIVIIASYDKYWNECLNRFRRIVADFEEGKIG